MDETMKKLIDTGAKLKDEANTGNMANNRITKAEADRIVTYTARYNYLVNSMKLAYKLFDVLGEQGYAIFRKYEESLTFESLAD